VSRALAGIERRVFLSCKTHAATDVLLGKIVELQQQMRRWRLAHPALFDRFIDARLLDLPLFRMNPREGVPDGVVPLRREDDRQPGDPKALEAVLAELWCIVASTPGGTYRMLKDAKKELTGQAFCHCVVLDEASQMNLRGAACRRTARARWAADCRGRSPADATDRQA
jgi:hypothetical protein